MNEFGFLSFDSKMRLLMIKKDDPQISKDHWVGVWIVGSFPLKRTKKQFSKQDAIWYSLLQYYTNPEIKSKISIVAKQKGFLCYFGLKKQKQKLDSPQFYFFQQSLTSQPKWSFSTKSEFISEWNKPLEVEIEFQNDTIPEETQMSEISDQPIPNIPPNPRMIKKGSLQENLSGVSANSNQGNTQIQRMRDELEEKDRIIKQLRIELSKSERRIVELEDINKILKQARQPQQPMFPFYPYPYPPSVSPYYQPMPLLQPNPQYEPISVTEQKKSSFQNQPEPEPQYVPKEKILQQQKVFFTPQPEEPRSKIATYQISPQKNANISFADEYFQMKQADEPKEQIQENVIPRVNQIDPYEDDEQPKNILPQNILDSQKKPSSLIPPKKEQQIITDPESVKVEDSKKDQKKLPQDDRSDDSSEEDSNMKNLRKKYLKK